MQIWVQRQWPRGGFMWLAIGLSFIGGYVACHAGLGQAWWPDGAALNQGVQSASNDSPQVSANAGHPGRQASQPWWYADGAVNATGLAASASAPSDGRSVTQRLAQIKALLLSGTDDDQQALSSQLAALAERLHTDPAARQAVLREFVAHAGSPFGDAIVSVLSMAGGPDTEAAGLRLVQAGATPQQRLSGLTLLSQLPSQDASTRAALLSMLQTESSPTDSDARVALLSALRRRGAVSPDEQLGVVNATRPLLTGADARVREEAIRLMSQWAPRDAGVFQSVVSAVNDSEPSVRITAIQALSEATLRTDQVRDTLVSRMTDTGEDTQVRMAAWQALENFELDPRSYALYQQFRQVLGTAEMR